MRKPTVSCVYRSGSRLRQLFKRKLLVCIDAETGGHAHRFFSNRARVKLTVLHKYPSCCQREISSRTDSNDSIVGFYDIAGSGKADETSLVEAILLAADLAKLRMKDKSQ